MIAGDLISPTHLTLMTHTTDILSAQLSLLRSNFVEALSHGIRVPLVNVRLIDAGVLSTHLASV